MKNLLSFLIVTALFLSGSVTAQYQKLYQSDPVAEDCFGWCVSVNGDQMVVGNIYDDDLNIQSGSADVFLWDGSSWVQEAKLLASDGGYAEYFGYDVEIHGSKIIVGAYRGLHQGEQCGKAYIYEKSGGTWAETAVLAPDGGIWDDRFGTNVDIYGNYAVVCAWGNDEAALDAGAAYVYKKEGSSWVLDVKLMPPAPTEGCHFAISATLNDEFLFINARESGTYPNASGVLYSYKMNNNAWEYMGTIVPDDTFEGMFFGNDMSVYDNTLLAGAYHDNVNGENSGSAYIFSYEGSQWVQQVKLIPADGHAGGSFGNSVRIYDDNILVGSVYHVENSYTSGAVYYYHFMNSVWELAKKIKQPDPVEESRFGASVSVYGESALIGCPFDDDYGYRSGAAYVYNLETLLGIETPGKNESHFLVFPTLSSGSATLSREDTGKELNVEVIGMEGRTYQNFVMPAGANELDIDFQGMGKGTCLIRVSEGHTTVYTAKVVVK